MSTIEKAVEKLGKQHPDNSKGSGVEPEDFSQGDFSGLEEPSPEGDAVKTVDELQLQASALPNAEVVELPFSRFEELGIITPGQPRSQIAEEYRKIKRPLIRNIAGDGAGVVERPNLIMVTSSFEGEGKTFSAINLMLSASMEKDKTVLFIDADVAKASSSQMLGVPNDAPGLIDILESEDVGVEDVLLQTNVPNIRMIPAGHVNDRSTELLASERMRQLMIELSQRYRDRIIIFDSPPLLQTSEANVLASLVGQIMFVVEAEKTTRSAVEQAINQIGDDKVVGMVLNKARKYPWDSHLHGRGYGYGYGYGHRARVDDGRDK